MTIALWAVICLIPVLAVSAILAFSPAHPEANTAHLEHAIHELQRLIPNYKQGLIVTAPSGLVQIQQSDLDNFTSEITAAVTVLGPYIQQLVASSTALSDADESAITAAIAQLQGLEPPAPAPSS